VKYIPLVWSGIWRKPGRTALILLQIALGFALFGVLQGMTSGVQQAVAKMRADVLFVAPAAFGGTPLPFSYVDRLKSLPGVQTVTYADGLPGSYQKPTQGVFALAMEPTDIWTTLVPDLFQIMPKDLDALRKNRTGALISPDIGKKYGWKIGDRIPLTSPVPQTNGSNTWYFDIVGTVMDHEPGESGLIVINYAYLDEARGTNKGTVRNFYVVVGDPHKAGAMAERIDHAFANSPNETRTSSFKENGQQALRRIGDLDFAIRSIISAVLIALLFSTCTMMMQTIRERTPELAVLKTLGFTDRTVFFMVVAEAALVCIVAALMGLGLAMGVFPFAGKVIPGLSMPIAVIGIGLIGAVLVALISVAMPASMAARLRVVDALAGR
jgi:putative ABC transport system permease protein